MSEREKFEIAYENTHKPIIARPYPKLENGLYQYLEIHEAWELWQAATAQAVPQGCVLDQAIAICENLANEWDSDAVVSNKNYAGECASKIKAIKSLALPEGYVVVPTTNVHTFYQDDDEPENCCNDESEFDLLGDCLDDGDIIVVNKITSAHLPSEKFYGTWVVDASTRKFKLFCSYGEARQAIKAAQGDE